MKVIIIKSKVTQNEASYFVVFSTLYLTKISFITKKACVECYCYFFHHSVACSLLVILTCLHFRIIFLPFHLFISCTVNKHTNLIACTVELQKNCYKWIMIMTVCMSRRKFRWLIMIFFSNRQTHLNFDIDNSTLIRLLFLLIFIECFIIS